MTLHLANGTLVTRDTLLVDMEADPVVACQQDLYLREPYDHTDTSRSDNVKVTLFCRAGESKRLSEWMNLFDVKPKPTAVTPSEGPAAESTLITVTGSDFGKVTGIQLAYQAPTEEGGWEEVRVLADDFQLVSDTEVRGRVIPQPDPVVGGLGLVLLTSGDGGPAGVPASFNYVG